MPDHAVLLDAIAILQRVLVGAEQGADEIVRVGAAHHGDLIRLPLPTTRGPRTPAVLRRRRRRRRPALALPAARARVGRAGEVLDDLDLDVAEVALARDALALLLGRVVGLGRARGPADEPAVPVVRDEGVPLVPLRRAVRVDVVDVREVGLEPAGAGASALGVFGLKGDTGGLLWGGKKAYPTHPRSRLGFPSR